MSLWARLDAACGAAADAVMGEPVRIVPRTESQYKGSVADASREAISLRGKFSLAPAVDGLDGANENRRKRDMGSPTTFGTAIAFVVIEAAEVAKIPFALRKKDHIELESRDPVAGFVIDLVDFTDTGAAILHLIARTSITPSGGALDHSTADSSGLAFYSGN